MTLAIGTPLARLFLEPQKDGGDAVFAVEAEQFSAEAGDEEDPPQAAGCR
jgi:hypothetical protein